MGENIRNLKDLYLSPKTIREIREVSTVDGRTTLT
jgi:hypothetical protein